jgi:hypothetical protein
MDAFYPLIRFLTKRAGTVSAVIAASGGGGLARRVYVADGYDTGDKDAVTHQAGDHRSVKSVGAGSSRRTGDCRPSCRMTALRGPEGYR